MADFKKVEPDLSFIRGVMDSGGETVNRCYQCATCSVVCPLSNPDRPFPRKEMLWAQWGLASKVSGDVDVWLCHQCGDCTAYCPRGARPGDVLAGIRNNAIKYYASPKGLADIMSRPTGVVAIIIFFILVVLGEIFLLGHPFIPKGEVDYEKVLTVLPIDAVFMPLAIFVVIVALKGVFEFWHDISAGAKLPQSYTGTYPRPKLGDLICDYGWKSIIEILKHDRFKKCGQTAERAKGHLWLLWSFIILFFVTNYVFIGADIFGMHVPLSMFHPVKILANIGAVMLIAGVLMVKAMRDQKTKEGVLSSATPDWILIYLILAVGVTGLGAEILRLLNIAVIAYPVYYLHLGCVAALFLAVPYTKFGHLVYRTTAYIFQRWSDEIRAGRNGFAKKMTLDH